jgi:putative tricarboxylic transport membrane protein
MLRIPFHYLAPGILMLATVGAFAVRNLVIDVIVMFVAGIVAFLMRRTGYSVAGIVLGLILGDIGEQNFAQAMQIVHYDPVVFFGRPIVSILMAGGALTLIANIIKAVRRPARVAGV